MLTYERIKNLAVSILIMLVVAFVVVWWFDFGGVQPTQPPEAPIVADNAVPAGGSPARQPVPTPAYLSPEQGTGAEREPEARYIERMLREQISTLEGQISDRTADISQIREHNEILENSLAQLQRELESRSEAAESGQGLIDAWREAGNLGFLKELGYVEAALLRKAGYYEMRVQINGANAYLLLDTGAATTIMDLTLIERFDAVVETSQNPRQYVGIGGSSESSKEVVIKSFGIESLEIPNLRLPLVDLSHVNKLLEDNGQYPVHGLIGDDLLEKQGAIIDFSQQRVYLRTAASR